LRIALISSHVQSGGAEKYFERLVGRLPPEVRGPIVLVGDGPLREQLAARYGRVHAIDYAGKGDLPRVARELRRELRAGRADAVLANGIQAAAAAGIANLTGATPVVWRRPDASFDGWFASSVALPCRYVVGNSGSVISGLNRRRLRSRLRIIHNGLPAAVGDRAAARQRLEELQGGLVPGPVLAVSGRLHPTKGQVDVVEIAPRLVARMPAVRILLFGDADADRPEHAEELRRRVDELGLSDVVLFMGYRDDAGELIAGVDVLLAPSRVDPATGWREGFPNSAVEAMAAGTPVLGYDHGPFREILGEHATLVPEGDRSALCDALIGVLTDVEATRERALAGQRFVRSRYAMDAAVQAWVELFEEAVSTDRWLRTRRAVGSRR
jgi:glycosyltransferase involved in cell wall biosynthesis